MEKLAYLVKHRAPGLFGVLARLAERATVLRYGRQTALAVDAARIDGFVKERAAVMRAQGETDANHLHDFLHSLPPEWCRHFRPHGFDRASLLGVLGSRAYLNYGMYVEGKLVGYGLLKISPTGSAFIGLLVHPEYAGLGLGKFTVDYLYWQASLSGLRTRSTISRENPASLRSHRAVAEFRIIAELPNDYLMIEFPRAQRRPPELNLP